MATQFDVQDDDALDLDDENEDQPGEEAEADDGDDGDDEPDGDDDSEEDVITFQGNEQREADEPDHIKDLRRRYREQKRELDQLREARAPVADEVGDKPVLADYWDREDEGEYERDLLAWRDRKERADQAQKARQEEAERAQRDYEADVAVFDQQRASLRIKDFDAANDKVREELSEVQQAIIVQAAQNKAALFYALGKNPERLKALAGERNPVRFTAAVVRLDMETRVEKRKPLTSPETALRGSGAAATRGDAQLARLEKEAERTGNRTQLLEYRRKQRERASA